jgi:hypothetical protein
MVGSVLGLVPLIGLLFTALVFFFFMHDNPERLFLFLIYYFVFDSSTLFNLNLVFTLEGINIFPEDLLTLFLAIELVFSVTNRQLSKKVSVSRYRLLGKFYLLLSISGLITWTYSVGIQPAVVNWRENLLCSLLILYCFSLNSSIRYELFSKALYRGSIFLSALILIRVVLHGVGDYSAISEVNGITERATTASGALFLLLALWNFLLQIETFDFKSAVYICWLMAEILVLQHRSVWIASMIGLLYLSLRLDNFRLKIRILVSLGVISPFLLFVVKNISFLSTAASDSGTLTWRILRWQGSLGQSKTNLQIVFGEIIGRTESIIVAGLDVAAHNMYVSLFEKFGIFGLLVFLVILIPSRIGSNSTPKFKNLDLVLTLTLVVFGMFYSFPYLAILILFSLRRIRTELGWRTDSALA